LVIQRIIEWKSCQPRVKERLAVKYLITGVNGDGSLNIQVTDKSETYTTQMTVAEYNDSAMSASRPMAQETIDKIRASMNARVAAFGGHMHDEATIERIRGTQKEGYASGRLVQPMKGKKYPESSGMGDKIRAGQLKAKQAEIDLRVAEALKAASNSK
jgi:hypothetical protein